EDILAREDVERTNIGKNLIDLEYKIRPLAKGDLKSLWVFGRGQMSTLLYSPRYSGILFNAAHRGAEREGRLVPHDKGLTDPSALYWWGKARHPFPFFVPKTKEISLKSIISFRSNKPTGDIAEKVRQFWEDGRSPIECVRMPKRSHDDSV